MEQRCWLLQCVRELWAGFTARFLALWDEHSGRGDACHAKLFGGGGGDGCAQQAQRQAQARFMANLWRDSVGFAGAVIVRRVVGIAHVADLDSIAGTGCLR